MIYKIRCMTDMFFFFLIRFNLCFVVAGVIIAASMGLGYSLENPQSERTIGDIQFRGNQSIIEKDLISKLPFRVGDLLDEKYPTLAKVVVTSIYRNMGYLDVTVDVSTVAIGSAVSFSITIIEGDLYRYGETVVENLAPLPEKVVLIEQTFQTGDPYDRRQLFLTQSRLFSTGYFEDISIDASTTTQKTADIRMRFKHQPHKWIKGGVGWGSEEKQRLSLGFLNNNFLRRAYRTEISATLSKIWLEYKAEFVNPYFFETRTEQRTVASWRHEDREGYDLELFSAEASLGRELTENIRGTVGYRLKRTLAFNLDMDLVTTPAESNSRTIALGLNRDTSDDPFSPSRGTRSNFIAEHTGGVLGGTLDFNKLAFQQTAYISVSKKSVFALSGRAGVIKEFSPSVEVPVFEKFFTGGANSVRGYQERTVGPKDSEDSPIGGNWLLQGSCELRFPVYRRLTGAVFLDGGMVGTHMSGVQFSRWKYGSGAGFRFKTPVGPFRLDYGHKLNPDAGDQDLWRVHFSLGESF